jgi:hypothetical protein
MTTKVIEPAQYVIEQYNEAGDLINQETFPGDTNEQIISDRASELETLNPQYKTISFYVSEVTEDIYLPGIVKPSITDSDTLFTVEGAVVETAKRLSDGSELPLVFFLNDPVSGETIQFFDPDGILVAEIVL